MIERKVSYSYLSKQFKNPKGFLKAIQAVVSRGDFTLGQTVTQIENKVAKLCGTKYAIGVNSGTDALFLILKTLNIGPGNEVITAPNSFIATTGAIVQTGARPVFVDIQRDYNLNPDLIEEKITSNTKAILPVHLTGNPAELDAIVKIANKHGLWVIEDAAQAIGAQFREKSVGSYGIAAGFSFHPLKNINGWGDGGMITTNSDELNERVRLLRNHGLKTRDECVEFGYNSRLDSIQAAILLEFIDDVCHITDKRIKLAQLCDSNLLTLQDFVILPPRRSYVRQVYHTYMIQARNRDALRKYLEDRHIDVKVHYPIPIHLQKAASSYGYKKGDFPICEQQTQTILTLPMHQELTEDDVQYMCDQIKNFYFKNSDR